MGGFYLNGFDFYREQNGQLVDITPSKKQFEHLYKARQAKERSCKAAHLDKKAFLTTYRLINAKFWVKEIVR